mmetsp:Transcript_71905/g.150225  ORF Transcript_71905/g.150225 Transcript_71905/m.150225 type:complete len:283 (+) Transcript_71905:307-1155(+)
MSASRPHSSGGFAGIIAKAWDRATLMESTSRRTQASLASELGAQRSMEAASAGQSSSLASFLIVKVNLIGPLKLAELRKTLLPAVSSSHCKLTMVGGHSSGLASPVKVIKVHPAVRGKRVVAFSGSGVLEKRSSPSLMNPNLALHCPRCLDFLYRQGMLEDSFISSVATLLVLLLWLPVEPLSVPCTKSSALSSSSLSPTKSSADWMKLISLSSLSPEALTGLSSIHSSSLSTSGKLSGKPAEVQPTTPQMWYILEATGCCRAYGFGGAGGPLAALQIAALT